MFELCASILAADFANLERDMRAANAAGVDAFHIDVMDGHFVPAISFGTGMVRTMERLTTKPLDVHLMVEKPLDFLPELEELGVKRVSVHYEIPAGRKRPAGHLRRRDASRAGTQPRNAGGIGPAVPGPNFAAAADDGTPRSRRAGLSARQQREDRCCQKSAARAGEQYRHPGGWRHHPRYPARRLCGGARSIVAGSAVFYGNIYQNVCALRSEKAKP